MAEMLGQFLAAASARDQWPPSAIEDCVEFGESATALCTYTNSVRAASMLRRSERAIKVPEGDFASERAKEVITFFLAEAETTKKDGKDLWLISTPKFF